MAAISEVERHEWDIDTQIGNAEEAPSYVETCLWNKLSILSSVGTSHGSSASEPWQTGFPAHACDILTAFEGFPGTQ